MTSRKAAYIDFSKPEYNKLSDNEVHLLKSVNAKGTRKNLRNCKVHGIIEAELCSVYDKDYNETNYFGCLKCLKNQ